MAYKQEAARLEVELEGSREHESLLNEQVNEQTDFFPMKIII